MPNPTTENAWTEIAQAFSNRAFMKYNPTWLWGISARSGPRRIARLEGSRSAIHLQKILADLGNAEIASLLVRSEVNLEQALSAFRLTLVVNISIPLGLMVLINQLAPGAIGNLLAETPVEAILVPLFLALGLLITSMWYAYAGALAARDLNHLLRLRLADAETGMARGLAGPAEIDPTVDGL